MKGISFRETIVCEMPENILLCALRDRTQLSVPPSTLTSEHSLLFLLESLICKSVITSVWLCQSVSV